MLILMPAVSFHFAREPVGAFLAVEKRDRRHAHDKVVGAAGHDASHRIQRVRGDEFRAGAEALVADGIGVRREDAAVVVVKALEAKVAQEGRLIFHRGAVAALEKAEADKEAHGEFESECPGYCGAQDTFYVGTLKGVGRIYQQTFIGTYSKVASRQGVPRFELSSSRLKSLTMSKSLLPSWPDQLARPTIS